MASFIKFLIHRETAVEGDDDDGGEEDDDDDGPATIQPRSIVRPRPLVHHPHPLFSSLGHYDLIKGGRGFNGYNLSTGQPIALEIKCLDDTDLLSARDLLLWFSLPWWALSTSLSPTPLHAVRALALSIDTKRQNEAHEGGPRIKKNYEP